MSGHTSEMAKLMRRARRLGFRIEASGTSHYRLVAPDGRVSFWSRSPGSGAAAVKLTAFLRHAKER